MARLIEFGYFVPMGWRASHWTLSHSAIAAGVAVVLLAIFLGLSYDCASFQACLPNNRAAFIFHEYQTVVAAVFALIAAIFVWHITRLKIEAERKLLEFKQRKRTETVARALAGELETLSTRLHVVAKQYESAVGLKLQEGDQYIGRDEADVIHQLKEANLPPLAVFAHVSDDLGDIGHILCAEIVGFYGNLEIARNHRHDINRTVSYLVQSTTLMISTAVIGELARQRLLKLAANAAAPDAVIDFEPAVDDMVRKGIYRKYGHNLKEYQRSIWPNILSYEGA